MLPTAHNVLRASARFGLPAREDGYLAPAPHDGLLDRAERRGQRELVMQRDCGLRDNPRPRAAVRPGGRVHQERVAEEDVARPAGGERGGQVLGGRRGRLGRLQPRHARVAGRPSTRAASRCDPGRSLVGALASSTSVSRYSASRPRARDR